MKLPGQILTQLHDFIRRYGIAPDVIYLGAETFRELGEYIALNAPLTSSAIDASGGVRFDGYPVVKVAEPNYIGFGLK